MSTVKKTAWVKSAFSQYDLSQTPAKNVETKNGNGAPGKGCKVTGGATGVEHAEITAAKEKPSQQNIDATDWISRFAPVNSEELAVHVKKLTEVRNWLQHCEATQRKHPAQICLLSGASGVGKTTCIRILAKELGYKLIEWVNPQDEEVLTQLGDQQRGGNYNRSHLDAFRQFLFVSSRFKSLLENSNKRLLLVEDFPNALLTDVRTFEEILNKYMFDGKCPLVFIVADSKSRGLNISYNLFADEIKQKFNIVHISFNAVADTFMLKAMKRFCALMRQHYAADYTVPTQSLIDSIVVSANGDIRNALINLHFSSLKGAPSLPMEKLTKIELNESKSGSKRKSKTQFKLKTVGRNESITMFHTLGRVFNPKRSVDGEMLHDPAEIANNFLPEPKRFTDLIHSNYLQYFGDISDVYKVANDLCLADLLFCEYRDEALALLGLNVAIRSVMLSNSQPEKGWKTVRGPKRVKREEKSAKKRELVGGCAGVTRDMYALDYATYVKLIAK